MIVTYTLPVVKEKIPRVQTNNEDNCVCSLNPGVKRWIPFTRI